MKIFIALSFTYDIIEVPFNDIKSFKSIIKKFDKFIHDKNNEHPYWIYQYKNKFVPEVNTDTLIWWLNNICLDNKKTAVIISRGNNLNNLDKCKESNVIYL